jgi:hypothetical protein
MYIGLIWVQMYIGSNVYMCIGVRRLKCVYVSRYATSEVLEYAEHGYEGQRGMCVFVSNTLATH